jgi:molecular chaperone GrpE
MSTRPTASRSPPSDPEILPAGRGGELEPNPTIEAELADTKDRLLRALADQENIRKQSRRDSDEAVRYAASALATDLLDTVDNLERAIDTATTSAPMEVLLDGVVATRRGLLDALERHGIKRIDPLGKAFDPHLHQAVFEQTDTGRSEGTVVVVLQPGYVHHDRLLRPAMVGLAKAGAPTPHD